MLKVSVPTREGVGIDARGQGQGVHLEGGIYVVPLRRPPGKI